MPRPPRIHVPDAFYHVTLRGNHRRAVFVEEGDQRLLNTIVARNLHAFDTRLHAYCWMSNHLHFLLQAGERPLANPMRNIASEFAREMQRKLETTGHFFERRYYAKLVDVDEYFLELVRYIHLNPVRAGMVANTEQFCWSSHHAYVGTRTEEFVTTDFALRMFGYNRESAVRNYLRFIDAPSGSGWSPDEIVNARAQELAPNNLFIASTALELKVKLTLDNLIDEACLRFNACRDHLDSPVRTRHLSKVRAWIASEAISRHVCSLAAVARALGRDESTLREAMRRHGSSAWIAKIDS
jgi:putative transposase